MNKNLRYVALVIVFSGSIMLSSLAQADVKPKAQSGDVSRGQILFAKYCTGCHGSEGEGGGYKFLRGPDPANLTSPSTKKKSDAVLLKTIHEGKPNMPPWKTRLSEKESREVLVYVRTLGK